MSSSHERKENKIKIGKVVAYEAALERIAELVVRVEALEEAITGITADIEDIKRRLPSS